MKKREAETIRRRVLPACAMALRMKWTRQRNRIPTRLRVGGARQSPKTRFLGAMVARRVATFSAVTDCPARADASATLSSCSVRTSIASCCFGDSSDTAARASRV